MDQFSPPTSNHPPTHKHTNTTSLPAPGGGGWWVHGAQEPTLKPTSPGGRVNAAPAQVRGHCLTHTCSLYCVAKKLEPLCASVSWLLYSEREAVSSLPRACTARPKEQSCSRRRA